MNGTDKVIWRFTNPRYIGVIRGPSVLIQIGALGCEDSLLLVLKIEAERIIEIKDKIFFVELRWQPLRLPASWLWVKPLTKVF